MSRVEAQAPVAPVAPVITVLLVEDSPTDARLVREMLADAGPTEFRLVHATRLAEALLRLQQDGDVAVILLDLSLPDGQGLDTVTRLHAAAPRVPIVVMSGCDDEALAIQGVREGAQDYLVKGRVESDLLVRALRYAIERQRAEDRLNAKTREQEAFIYTVSHDLKAPLVSLQGMAGLLVKEYGERLEADARLYVERIAANAHKMQALLDDLLALSRLERVHAECAEIDLDVVVAKVTEQLRHTLDVRGATVRVEGRLPLVHANRTRMAQVFSNLIDNAVKYTPAERAPLIVLRATERSDCWEIAVSDNGVGIPAAFHAKVLDIFQRLPEGKRLHPDGTGVGLAIVARIVELGGGRLWITSEDGQGATFHVTIPKQPAARS